MSEAWTTLKVLDWTAGRFERAGQEGTRLDAQILLAHVLKCPRMALYTSFDSPLAPGELTAYRELIQRRLDGEPVAYLTGTQEFWSLPFSVDERVLIPRPDTETLVQVALELGDSLLGEEGGALRVVEVATGSGAVSVALAHERKEWQFVATDISADALEVAKRNAEANTVSERIELRQGHLLEPLVSDSFSLLVSNLPYISEADMKGLSADVLHEPHSALCGGPKGTELISEMVGGLVRILEPGGWAALEHGFDQGEAICALASEAGCVDVQTRSDLAGRARVTFFRMANRSI
ncbi:MAG: peptide chain release factor N(5)-glutamine methyltransferase [Myxococcales bacterium]|nr:peptide chain release factor N(5)-glutamine methyltransferase [Myxococcales bacterium]